MADPHLGTRVHLALECLQVTGSFHVRGALYAIASREPALIVAPGVGHHGVAVAYAAAVLGRACTLVVADEAPPWVVSRAAAYGARLVTCVAAEPDEDCGQTALRYAEESGASVLLPNDAALCVGNGGSLAEEIVDGLGRVPATVLVPSRTGGVAGSLACGIAAQAGESWEGASRVCGVAIAEPGTSPQRPESTRGVPRFTVGADEARAEAAAIATTFAVPIEPWAAAGLALLRDGLPAQRRGGDLVVLLPARSLETRPPARGSLPPPRLSSALVRRRA